MVASPVTEKMRKDMWPLRAFAHYVPDNFAELPDPDPPIPLDDYEYKQALKQGKTTLMQQLGVA